MSEALPGSMPIRGDETHEELDAIAERTDVSICWCHCAVEPIPEDVYRICFECGHVWTRRALVRAYRREYRSLGWLPFPHATRMDRVLFYWRRFWRPLTVRASRIYFCQECIHDW